MMQIIISMFPCYAGNIHEVHKDRLLILKSHLDVILVFGWSKRNSKWIFDESNLPYEEALEHARKKTKTEKIVDGSYYVCQYTVRKMTLITVNKETEKEKSAAAAAAAAFNRIHRMYF